ncbi:competence protein CoiA [Paenibacillus sp. 4624]|uniref:competence protein CoiA family protein n=1 Tax=Paenibacillus sp. 4624 TaxID=3156453 RepID=UPI003D1D0096
MVEEKYSTASVEYEVHIPQTGQIVDVYVKHNDGELSDQIWAFEFQHSVISSTLWKERHELYVSAGIQDFWFLDKAKFMKFSSAKGVTDARLRKDLDKTIFDEIGLCYFLDLETSELIIDFDFKTEVSYLDIGRSKRVKQSHVYHDPRKHSAPLDDMRVRMNKETRYCVLVCDDLEKSMETRLVLILQKLKKAKETRIRRELNNRARNLIEFAQENYGYDFAYRFEEIIRESKSELQEDILAFDNNDFYIKYKPIIETYIANIKEYNSLKENPELIPRFLCTLTSMSDLRRVRYLQEQESLSLENYLKSKYREKLALVQYVYDKYKTTLDHLTTKRKDWINEMLGLIDWKLQTYAKEPDVIDYAIAYGALESSEVVDNYIQQVKDRIVNKPILNLEDLKFD